MGAMKIRRTTSTFGLLELQYRAWYEERAWKAESRIIEAHLHRVTKRRILAEAEFTAQRDMERLHREVDTARFERSLWQNVQEPSLLERSRLLQRQIDTEKLLVTISDLKRQRATGTTKTDLAPPSHVINFDQSTEPPMGPYVSDEQIQALALKPLLRFGHLDQGEAERAWKTYHDELRKRFPTHIAEEVARRIVELRAAAS